MPPNEKIFKVYEKKKRRMIPNQKIGIEKKKRLDTIAAISPRDPRNHARRTPPPMPMRTEMIVAVPKRRSVGPTRSRISELTGRPVWNELPKFPVSIPAREYQNSCHTGRSTAT